MLPSCCKILPIETGACFEEVNIFLKGIWKPSEGSLSSLEMVPGENNQNKRVILCQQFIFLKVYCTFNAGSAVQLENFERGTGTLCFSSLSVK